MSSTIAPSSIFSTLINTRIFQRHSRSDFLRISFTSRKVLIVMSSDIRGTEASNLATKTSTSYLQDSPISQNGSSLTSPEFSNGHLQEPVTALPKKSAKIHDFCLGIPFGALVVSGGLVGFIISKNFVSLSSGLLFGGAILGLSTLSLKVWRQGKSSLPFILGQAALSIALLWKSILGYTLTKKLFPTGFNAVISGAMLCFYAHVVFSGGNPPPKKKSKPLASVQPSET